MLFAQILELAWKLPTPAPIPEPSTLLLVGLGLIGLALVGQYRRS